MLDPSGLEPTGVKGWKVPWLWISRKLEFVWLKEANVI